MFVKVFSTFIQYLRFPMLGNAVERMSGMKFDRITGLIALCNFSSMHSIFRNFSLMKTNYNQV